MEKNLKDSQDEFLKSGFVIDFPKGIHGRDSKGIVEKFLEGCRESYMKVFLDKFLVDSLGNFPMYL